MTDVPTTRLPMLATTRLPTGQGPRPTLAVAPVVVVPGRPAVVELSVANPSPANQQVRLAVHGTGLYVPAAVRTIEIPAGSVAAVELEASLPEGSPAGRHRCAVVATSEHGTVVADVDLVVLGRDDLRARLVDPEPGGGGRGRTNLEVQNRSAVALPIWLSASSPAKVRLAREAVVPPATTIAIPVVVRAPRPLTGSPRRVPFVVDVEGAGLVSLPGTFVQRPTLSRGTIRIALVIAVLSIWAAAALAILAAVSR